jgi:2-oxoglutarate ferredoxin oxidoreductase subunit gamma
MGKQIEIRLSGAGGQGIVLGGIILAEAAGIYEGRHVVQNQSYGVEARGGASRAEIIISDQEIVYPEVVLPDILLAMNKQALEKYQGKVSPQGTLLYNTYLADQNADSPAKAFGLPLTEIAKTSGGEVVSNIVALGALVGLTGVVSLKAVEKSLEKRVPPGTMEKNRKALAAGFKVAQELGTTGTR